MSQIAALGKVTVGLTQFPGSNCDTDCVDALKRHFGIDVKLIWHHEKALPKLDALIIPGGFSFGDYLRSGALASHSPVMQAVKNYAAKGGAIIGICNGFQILTESHLLPGVLLRNRGQKFVCKYVNIKSPTGPSLKIPVAHGEGRYFIDAKGLADLKANDQIAYQYVDAKGECSDESNPNGAVANIAGIYSRDRKILGLMPHPERATDELLGGSADGLTIWREFLNGVL